MKTCQTVGPADCSAGFLHDVVVSGILQNTSIKFFWGVTNLIGISTKSLGIPTNPCSVPTTFFRKSTNWDLPTNSPSISTNFPVISTNPRSVPTNYFRKSTTPGFTYKSSSDINKFPGNIYKSLLSTYKFLP